MRKTRNAVWLATMLIMTGCAVDASPGTDEIDGESSAGKTSTDPSQTYNAQVKPIVTSMCLACHNTDLRQPNLTSYATLAPQYKTPPGATSPLVTKGLHEGPTFSQSQANTIIAWINSLPPPDPSATFDSQIKPIVAPKCVPCHSGSQPPNLTSYAALEGPYKVKPGANNPLITKSNHEGPAFTATERTTVINWIDSLPSGVSDPAQTYETQVKPIFAQVCLACHSGTVQPNLSSYATLANIYKQKPGATNRLVTKSAHEGPALTPVQRDIVIKWIDSQP